MAKRTVDIVISAKDRASRKFGKVGGAARGMSNMIKASAASAMRLGVGLAAIGTVGVGAMLAVGKVFSSVGDQMAKMSKRTGFSVETLSELKFVASQTGAEFGGFEKTIAKMQRSIYDANRGLSTQVDAFADLGLATKDFEGLSPEQQFKLLADRIGSVEDPTKKAAIAMSLLGRGGTALLPMFAKGAAGIEELQKKARGLGLTISAEDAAKAEKFTDIMDTLGKVVKMGIFRVGAVLAPIIEKVAKAFQKAMPAIQSWVTAFAGGLAKLMEKGHPVFEYFSQAIRTMRAVWTTVFSAIGNIFESFGVKFSGVGDIVNAYFTWIKKASTWMAKGFIYALTAIEVAIINWRDVLNVAWLSAKLGMITYVRTLKHFFTVAIPEYLRWFADNWKEIFQTIWNGMKTFAANVWENLKNLFSAIKGLFKGEGWNFEWTGLMDGFENTIKEMPKVMARQLGEDEKELKRQIGELGKKLGDEFQKKLAPRLKLLDGGEGKPGESDVKTATKKAAAAILATVQGGGGAGTTGGGSGPKSLAAVESRFLTRAPGHYDPFKDMRKDNRRIIKNTERTAKATEAAATKEPQATPALTVAKF